MAYKSLLCILTEEKSVRPLLEAATDFARRADAHLDVLALGIDRSQIGYSYIGGAAVLSQVSLERAEQDAEALSAAAKSVMERQDVRWSSEAVVAQLGGMADLVALRARFSDLVILPRPYASDGSTDSGQVAEAAMFEGQAPVLILPPGKGVPDDGGRIVVAWNQSREAMVAVRAALPFLRVAEQVNVAVIDPPQYGPERSDPGGLLCQFLVRHGVRAEVSVLARTQPRVSDVLQRHLREQDAGMLVMGAYGHSRFREAIIGGATRDMLEEAEVPVFLAH
jgi:nucleotide-binding universal stress UspA family protein